MLAALGRRLRALRRAQGLTQRAVAERGLSDRYDQRIEAGRVNATVRTPTRVAGALGVPLAALVDPVPSVRGDRARAGGPRAGRETRRRRGGRGRRWRRAS